MNEFDLKAFLKYLGLQWGSVVPLTLPLAVAALRRGVRSTRPEERYLFWCFAPMMAFFMAVSWTMPTHVLWPLPCWLGITVVMSGVMTQLKPVIASRYGRFLAGFSAVLRRARERAITSRQSHTVVIDPPNHKMTVLAGADGEVRETRPLPERLTVEATPPPALSVRFEPEGTSSGADYKVRAGDVVYRVTVDPITGRVKNSKL